MGLSNISVCLQCNSKSDLINLLFSLKDVYPALFEHYDDHGHLVEAITEGKQAVNQLIAAAITFIIAIAGGGLTGKS